MAARRGRGDILTLARERGVPVEIGGIEALLAACATGDDNTGGVRRLLDQAR
jgi:hypothetical protein